MKYGSSRKNDGLIWPGGINMMQKRIIVGGLVSIVGLAGFFYFSHKNEQEVEQSKMEAREEGRAEIIAQVRERFEKGLDLRCNNWPNHDSHENSLPYIITNTTPNKADGQPGEFQHAQLEYFCPGQGVRKFQIK